MKNKNPQLYLNVLHHLQILIVTLIPPGDIMLVIQNSGFLNVTAVKTFTFHVNGQKCQSVVIF